MIEFQAVTKEFLDGTVAVDRLSMSAPAGRITVLVGPPGAGKTTILRMVNRLVEPTIGRVLVEGVDVGRGRASLLRRGIGYVPREPGLLPHKTVLDNVAAVPRLLGWRRSAARDAAAAMLTRIGLQGYIGQRYPIELSRGQQQGVALARALVAEPSVVLLEEPFAPIDASARRSLVERFRALQRDLGATVLHVTRDIEEALSLGDHVAVFESGRLLQLATPAEVVARPANDAVIRLLGEDRGLRRLTLLSAADLPIHAVTTVPVGVARSQAKNVAEHAGNRWLLALDESGAPGGWLDTADVGISDVVTVRDLEPLGATFTPADTVRQALDAAVYTAAGQAVCVDDVGTVIGAVSHNEIARFLAKHPPALPAAEAAVVPGAGGAQRNGHPRAGVGS